MEVTNCCSAGCMIHSRPALEGLGENSGKDMHIDHIRKEKAPSEELLLNILPETVAEELKAKSEAEARERSTRAGAGPGISDLYTNEISL